MSKKAGKEKHPLYHSWYSAKRKNDLCEEWKNDFWLFVAEVGDRPINHILRRKNLNEKFNKDNFKWVEKQLKFKDYQDRNAYMREYRKRTQNAHKHYEVKRRYGITLEQYNEMKEAQNNVCLLCGNPETDVDKRTNKVRDLAVDHCHTTHKVRGLLCRGCNQGLGNFKDNTEVLQKAINYLTAHE